MTQFKFLPALYLCILSFVSFAQGNKYDLSTPVDINQTGVNKVLCMKSGRTMLFHLEPGKDIVVKVFDTSHKQIASQEISCRILDLYIIKDAIFKGLFEINDEAVLFIDQEHLSRHGLVRLRFSGKDGKLVEEKLAGESKSATKRTRFYVMNNKNEDNYAILFSTEVPQFLDCKVYVGYYNKMHEEVREVPIEVDRKRYDYMRVVNAESQPNGISISLSLAKIKQNGTTSTFEDEATIASVYDHHLAMYYVAKDSTRAISTVADVSPDIYPYFSNYTYNEFAKTLNLLLLSYKSVQYKNGLDWQPAAMIQHLFFKLDEHDMSLDYKWIKHKMATDLLKQKLDSNKVYDGIPVSMFTNENGLTTVVSQSFGRYWEPETRARTMRNSYMGRIGITQIDDDGNEIWGTAIPFAQRYMSYQTYYSPFYFSKKWQSLILFGDLPDQVYNRQFVSVNCYPRKRDLFIVYNDNSKNFNNSIENPGDTVYNFGNTNACYYKLTGKKELTKHYLFGEPKLNEYTVSFIEGAGYDDKTGTYASLVQYKRGDNTSLRMAWSHLE